MSHLYFDDTNTDGDPLGTRSSSHAHSSGMAPKEATPSKELPAIPEAPSPMKNAGTPPDTPATGKVSNIKLSKHSLKGSMARLVVQALMGNRKAARAVKAWEEEDLAVLSPNLILAIQFASLDLDPFDCSTARVAQGMKSLN